MNEHDEPDTTPAPDPDSGRFAIFAGEDDGWVLRDNTTKPAFDYPFVTREGALAGIDRRLEGHSFTGSKARLNAYGQPLNSLEVFA